MYFFLITSCRILQHRSHVVRNLERCFSLGFDLVNSDTISKLNKGEAVGKVNIKNALLNMLAKSCIAMKK